MKLSPTQGYVFDRSPTPFFHFISYNLVKSVTLYREITIKFTRVLVILVLSWSPDMTPASQIERKKGILCVVWVYRVEYIKKRTRISDAWCHSFGPQKNDKKYININNIFQLWVYGFFSTYKRERVRKVIYWVTHLAHTNGKSPRIIPGF